MDAEEATGAWWTHILLPAFFWFTFWFGAQTTGALAPLTLSIMADAEEDGMDLETLQAQIDMSMAFTHDLVSGWMKASKAKLPSSSRANDDRELEEYMRRPPRYVFLFL